MQKTNLCATVVFSKDRAMQLDACLRSFYLHCRDADRSRVRVIYACTTERHKAQYAVLRETYPQIHFIYESIFSSDLVLAIENSEKVLFLVDDNIFIREWSLHETLEVLDKNQKALGFSLRLGRNTTHCYSLNNPQILPEFTALSSKVLKFCWVDAEYDFGYPLEISSSIYRTEQLLPILRAAPTIHSPNTLEAALDDSKNLFRVSHPDLACFANSVAFCNPANLVQTDHFNRSCIDSLASIIHLMQRFDLGYRIDVARLVNFSPEACHQEVDFEYQSPADQWDSMSISVKLHSATKSELNQATSGSARNRNAEVSIAGRLDIASLPDESKIQALGFIYLLETYYCSSNPEWFLDVMKASANATVNDQAEVARILSMLKAQLEENHKREYGWYKPELARYQQQLNEAQAELGDTKIKLTNAQAELSQLKNSGA